MDPLTSTLCILMFNDLFYQKCFVEYFNEFECFLKNQSLPKVDPFGKMIATVLNENALHLDFA